MNVTGIIAEYNPFHNGHLYQLEKARNDTNADYLIVVMSGDFCTAGCPRFDRQIYKSQNGIRKRSGSGIRTSGPLVYGKCGIFCRGRHCPF